MNFPTLPILDGYCTIQLYRPIIESRTQFEVEVDEFGDEIEDIQKYEWVDNILVDEVYFEELDQYRWQKVWCDFEHSHAVRWEFHPDGLAPLMIYMERVIREWDIDADPLCFPIIHGLCTIPLYREVVKGKGDSRYVEDEQCDVTVVDDFNYHELNQYKWYKMFNPDTRVHYAGRTEQDEDGQTVFISMAREIMGLPRQLHHSYET